MKIILKDDRRYVLRFDKDEELLLGLVKFLKDEKIMACAFSGIGACSSFELGYYNAHLKDYRKKPFLDEMEIVAFTGTGGMKAGEPIIHAHGLFSRNDFTTIGGHVFKLVASPTCEIFLIKLDGELKRETNPDWNLNLLT